MDLAWTGRIDSDRLGVHHLPFDSVRLMVGEAAACLAWGACLLVFVAEGEPSRRPRFLIFFLGLLTSILCAHGLSTAIKAINHKDVYFIVTSILATATSAISVVLLGKGALESKVVRQTGLR